MSVPDCLLGEDSWYCLAHDRWYLGRQCPDCRDDNTDLYADMKIQDENERT
jgi:hypothetical protein